MSLLDRGPAYEPCVVYPEVLVPDKYGNPMAKPSDTGVMAKARFQEVGPGSGVSSEKSNIGFETIEAYSVRFPRSFSTILGPQSQIEWLGTRWSVVGPAHRYNGSPQTARLTYTIKRY